MARDANATQTDGSCRIHHVCLARTDATVEPWPLTSVSLPCTLLPKDFNGVGSRVEDRQWVLRGATFLCLAQSYKKEDKVTQKKGSEKSSAQEGSTLRAVLFELDNAACNGRTIFLETMKNVLAEKEIELTTELYLKCFVEKPLKDGLTVLLQALGRQKLSKEKLLAEIEAAFNDEMGRRATFNTGFVEVVRLAEANKWPVGILTCLTSQTAAGILEKAGIAEAVKVVQSCASETEKFFPARDAWRRLARQVDVIPRRCGAIVSSSMLAQSALCSGMRVFAVPDDFTSYQDFGGCESVYGKFDQSAARNMVQILSGK